MKIGYACKTVGVPYTQMSSCLLKNATEDNVRTIITKNLNSLNNILDYNISNNVRLFRISSDIIPFASHPINKLDWWKEFEDTLTQIGKKIKTSPMRVSMHPGQYTVLNSPNNNVVNNAISDLIYHGRFLDSLGVDSKNKIVLHVGGVYNDKELSKRRFVQNFERLDDTIKSRLIIENDDKNFNIFDVLEISSIISCPVVFDNLHNSINPSHQMFTDAHWIKECSKSWAKKDGIPKIHYSQQKSGANIGAHSETILIEEFLNFYKDNLAGQKVDIMLEVKDKNLSALKCINTLSSNLPPTVIEKEWARYKYFVLSRSARIYNEIRQLVKEKDSCLPLNFYKKIEESLLIPEDIGAQVNSAQHIWGYLSKLASPIEKKKFEKLVTTFTEKGTGTAPIKNFLKKLSEKQNVDYLLNSLYFYI